MSGFIADVWSSRILNELKKRKNLYDLTDRGYQIASKGGVVVVPSLDNVSVQDETAEKYELQKTNNKNDSRITLDKLAVATIGVGVVEQSQANTGLLDKYAKKAAEQTGRKIDLRVASTMLADAAVKATYAEIASGSSRLTKSVILGAQEVFNNNDIPIEKRFLVVDAAGYKDLMDVNDFVDYQKIAYAADKSPLATGLIGNVLGFNVYMHSAQPKVSDTGTLTGTLDKRSALFFQEEAFAVVIGLAAEAKSAYNTDYGMDVVQLFTSYGIKTMQASGILALRQG